MVGRTRLVILLLCVGSIGAGLWWGGSVAAAPPPNFDETTVMLGLDQPIALAFLPDGRMLVLQKEGEILIADPLASPVVATPYLTLDEVETGGERGLIDITLDPAFTENGYFYLYYAYKKTSRFRISRFVHTEDGGDVSSETVLWEDNEPASGCCHFGGGLDFGPDGRIYLTTGDEFDGPQSQDLTRAGGKVHRINADGSIPPDNPFFDGPGPNVDSIWATGLRNPFRARWDLITSQLYIGEVGSNNANTAWEDLHLGIAGANYGWPFCEGPCDNPGFPACHCDRYHEALFTYPHEGDGAALIGGVVYRGRQFPCSLDGAYFYGDYMQQYIRYLTFDATGTVVTGDFEFDPTAGDVVSIEQSPDGSLYYSTNSGWVRRYVYLSDPNPADIDADGVVDMVDLILLIEAWGSCPEPCPPACPADIAPPGAGDCVVNVLDLIELLLDLGMDCPRS